FESVHRRKDGSRFPVVVHVTAAGPDRRAVVVQDISERKAAEEELHRSREQLAASESRYRTIVANLPDTVVALFDRDLRFVALEGKGMEATGYSASAMIGPRPEEVLPDSPSVDLMLASYREALAGRTSRVEYPPTVAGRVYVSETLPLRAETGEVTGGMAV